MVPLLLLGCTSPSALRGEVVDVWGEPVGGASVVVEGVVERFHTDRVGRFTIETTLPVERAMAGKAGFIKAVLEVPPPGAGGRDYAPLRFELYPEPEVPGFYAVGAGEYVRVTPRRVHAVGTDLRHFVGLREVPEEPIPGGRTRFVFTSRLQESELLRMNLHLTRLSFVHRAPVKGVLGPVDATVDLWVAAAEVPFDLAVLPSRDDYLITTREPLVPGIYAFHAQDVLNDQAAGLLQSLPREMQIAFPFEVR